MKKLEFYDEVAAKSFQDIKDTAKILEELGITKADIAKNLKVLGYLPADLKLRYACLKELGFEVIESPELIW